METLLNKASLDPILSLRIRIEKQIRAQCSEAVILEIYEKLYKPVKEAISPVIDSIERAMLESSGLGSPITNRERHRISVQNLRNLVAQNAKERDLQNALIESGFMNATCNVVEEVSMEASNGSPGMRMDLFLPSFDKDASQIIELKRGSHLLLAHAGKESERLSSGLKRAISQVKGYGDRIFSDDETKQNLEKQLGVTINKPELRLVAGRRPSDPSRYHLISQAELFGSENDLSLQIYTWDGLIAELERIFD